MHRDRHERFIEVAPHALPAVDSGLLANQLALRLSDDDLRRLEDLGTTLSILSRNAIARAAMRIGLSVLEGDPRKIAEIPVAIRGRRRRAPLSESR